MACLSIVIMEESNDLKCYRKHRSISEAVRGLSEWL